METTSEEMQKAIQKEILKKQKRQKGESAENKTKETSSKQSFIKNEGQNNSNAKKTVIQNNEDVIKETKYCYLMKQSRLDVDGDEYSYMIEKIKVKEHNNREEIRFSIYKDIIGFGEKLIVRPMDLQESLLLQLIQKAVIEGIFSNEFVESLKEHYDYIVFDEAHHAQAANCKKTLQYFTPKYLIGLTATPERLDKRKLDEIFGQYETKLTLREAIQKGVISNIRCYRLISNIDLSEVRYNGKDYNYADLEKTLVIDSRNELIVNTIKKYFKPQKDFFKQGIVFCVNIQHCKKIEKLFNEAGIKAKAVYGLNKDNDEIFEKYRNKEIQFLLSCQVISEGLDCPQTEIVVMA